MMLILALKVFYIYMLKELQSYASVCVSYGLLVLKKLLFQGSLMRLFHIDMLIAEFKM